jgi:hypothetical protein
MDHEERIAQRAVDNILKDLTDRSGLGNAWEDIDEDIQEEIKEEWRQIIIRELRS